MERKKANTTFLKSTFLRHYALKIIFRFKVNLSLITSKTFRGMTGWTNVVFIPISFGAFNLRLTWRVLVSLDLLRKFLKSRRWRDSEKNWKSRHLGELNNFFWKSLTFPAKSKYPEVKSLNFSFDNKEHLLIFYR